MRRMLRVFLVLALVMAVPAMASAAWWNTSANKAFWVYDNVDYDGSNEFVGVYKGGVSGWIGIYYTPLLTYAKATWRNHIESNGTPITGWLRGGYQISEEVDSANKTMVTTWIDGDIQLIMTASLTQGAYNIEYEITNIGESVLENLEFFEGGSFDDFVWQDPSDSSVLIGKDGYMNWSNMPVMTWKYSPDYTVYRDENNGYFPYSGAIEHWEAGIPIGNLAPGQSKTVSMCLTWGKNVSVSKGKLEEHCNFTVEVPVDIKPQSCPNPLNVKSNGVLPVAIVGTADLDVTQIDIASISLAGVAPLRSDVEDVTAPFEPYTGKASATDCNADGADGYADLTLKFDRQAVVDAIGSVQDGEAIALELTGTLNDGTPIAGEDIVLIRKKGK